jgi:LPXTG-motif cell wall-anchored protein
MATFWFVLSGVCLVAGALLLVRARRRAAPPEEPVQPGPPARREGPEEEPFDLFKES